MKEISLIDWSTGTPSHTCECLLKLYDGKVVSDTWLDPNMWDEQGGWTRYDSEDVIAWCEFDSIM